jgi:hypothetical protein
MRIIRNERRINTFSFIGKYATLSGLMILLAGLILSFTKPDLIALMLICMAVGFGFSMVGGFFADRYVGPLAHHDALPKALKGLSDQYALLQYTLPASHVLVEPGGCTVFVVKSQGGQVTYDGNRWRHHQRGKFFRQFAGQEAVGAPDYGATHQMHRLERWLAHRLPDVDVPLRAVIVFVNPNVTVDAADSPVLTLHSKKVKSWLRGTDKLKPLPTDTYRQLTEATEIDT